MKKYYLYLHLIIVLSVFGCNQLVSQDSFVNAEPEQFQSLISKEKVQLIDVRTPEEFKEGHLNHALNIDYYSDSFSSEISKLDNQKPVYIYCHSGKRSTNSVAIFKKAGFTKIYNLDGGIQGWKSLNLPLASKE
jgi:rhodanese-related sulfurtransferase